MAGSYPDVPSRRMALDDDGTVIFQMYVWPDVPNFTTSWTDLTGTSGGIGRQNPVYPAGEARIGGSDDGRRGYGYIFPELRELDGVWVRFWEGGVINSQGKLISSGDTTNGIDGTWDTEVANMPSVSSTEDSYRTQITSLARSNVRAVEVDNQDDDSNCRQIAFHVYGIISPGQTPDRLLYVDATSGLEFSLPFDYGDIPRGSAEDRTFKLKNNSASLSATTVQLTAEDAWKGSGSWFTFSEGGTFQSTLLLAASIGSGASSPTLTVRRVTPDGAALGLYQPRVQASVGSWT